MSAAGTLLPFAILCAAPCALHEGSGAASGLVAGLLHPVGGADHVLAMVAVGIWGAQLCRPALWLLPVAFPLVMALGGALALIGVPLPGVEVGIALSALVIGVLVLTECRPAPWIAALVVGAFALFHGHAHGTELPADANGIYYSVGFVVATGCLHAAGIALGLLHRWRDGRRALRAAGALIAAGGAWFLWSALA